MFYILAESYKSENMLKLIFKFEKQNYCPIKYFQMSQQLNKQKKEYACTLYILNFFRPYYWIPANKIYTNVKICPKLCTNIRLKLCEKNGTLNIYRFPKFYNLTCNLNFYCLLHYYCCCNLKDLRKHEDF